METVAADGRVTVRYSLAGERVPSASGRGDGGQVYHAGMAVFHVEDGELVEGWHVTDAPGVGD